MGASTCSELSPMSRGLMTANASVNTDWHFRAHNKRAPNCVSAPGSFIRDNTVYQLSPSHSTKKHDLDYMLKTGYVEIYGHGRFFPLFALASR